MKKKIIFLIIIILIILGFYLFKNQPVENPQKIILNSVGYSFVYPDNWLFVGQKDDSSDFDSVSFFLSDDVLNPGEIINILASNSLKENSTVRVGDMTFLEKEIKLSREEINGLPTVITERSNGDGWFIKTYNMEIDNTSAITFIYDSYRGDISGLAEFEKMVYSVEEI